MEVSWNRIHLQSRPSAFCTHTKTSFRRCQTQHSARGHLAQPTARSNRHSAAVAVVCDNQKPEATTASATLPHSPSTSSPSAAITHLPSPASSLEGPSSKRLKLDTVTKGDLAATGGAMSSDEDFADLEYEDDDEGFGADDIDQGECMRGLDVCTSLVSTTDGT